MWGPNSGIHSCKASACYPFQLLPWPPPNVGNSLRVFRRVPQDNRKSCHGGWVDWRPTKVKRKKRMAKKVEKVHPKEKRG